MNYSNFNALVESAINTILLEESDLTGAFINIEPDTETDYEKQLVDANDVISLQSIGDILSTEDVNISCDEVEYEVSNGAGDEVTEYTRQGQPIINGFDFDFSVNTVDGTITVLMYITGELYLPEVGEYGELPEETLDLSFDSDLNLWISGLPSEDELFIASKLPRDIYNGSDKVVYEVDLSNSTILPDTELHCAVFNVTYIKTEHTRSTTNSGVSSTL